jgi:hypothetical protein
MGKIGDLLEKNYFFMLDFRFRNSYNTFNTNHDEWEASMSNKSKRNKKAEPNLPAGKKEDSTITVAKITQIGVITVGIITVVGTIISALLSSSIVEDFFRANIPSSTPTIIALTEAFMPSPLETPTATLEFSPAPVATETFTPFAVETTTPAESKVEILTVLLNASSNSGKASFQVNFNAKDSFITFTNGMTSSCFNSPNACIFTWTVSREGTIVYGPEQGNAGFSYRFEKKGRYFVSVNVCRGYTCNNSSTVIDAK